jgi:hypothetical protein
MIVNEKRKSNGKNRGSSCLGMRQGSKFKLVKTYDERNTIVQQDRPTIEEYDDNDNVMFNIEK